MSVVECQSQQKQPNRLKFLPSSSRKEKSGMCFQVFLFLAVSAPLIHSGWKKNPPVGVNPCLVRVLKYQLGSSPEIAYCESAPREGKSFEVALRLGRANKQRAHSKLKHVTHLLTYLPPLTQTMCSTSRGNMFLSPDGAQGAKNNRD